jgi:hypothetical protein
MAGGGTNMPPGILYPPHVTATHGLHCACSEWVQNSLSLLCPK